MAYATLSELRTFGVTTAQANDTAAQAALDLASEIIEDHTDTTFGPEAVATKTIPTRYGAQNLRLPRPFRAITSVSIGSVALSATSYQVTETGLVFPSQYRDADGYLVSNYIGRPGGPVSATVTGTFGWGIVPLRVKRSCLLLAADFCRPASSGGSDTSVKSLSVEGYSVTYRDNLSFLATTGNAAADQLLTGLAQPVSVL